MSAKRVVILASIFFSFVFGSCAAQPPEGEAPTPPGFLESGDARLEAIPSGAVKGIPEEDHWPPIVHSGWSQPEPMEFPINTAGGEDSPFFIPDGQTLYFFFTPDVNIPAELQVLDGLTGIWVTHMADGEWTLPERVWLADDPSEYHMDGCPAIHEGFMFFCSIRAENVQEIEWYNASQSGSGQDVQWGNVENSGELLNNDYGFGELHISMDGDLYFGADKPGGYGRQDLWVSRWTGENWGEPVNLGPSVNSSGDEGRPYVSPDGLELWFDVFGRSEHPGPAVFRSLRQTDGSWGPAEEVFSQFAGEPTLTGDGQTIVFVHHYFSADMSQMIEADLYFANRLQP